MKRRLFSVALAAITIVVVTGGFWLYLQRQESKERSMSLTEALWVCDEAMKNFYPPGSPESRSVVAQLAQTGLEVGKPQYHSYVCLRLLGPDAGPNAVAVWGPFDPENPAPFIESHRPRVPP